MSRVTGPSTRLGIALAILIASAVLPRGVEAQSGLAEPVDTVSIVLAGIRGIQAEGLLPNEGRLWLPRTESGAWPMGLSERSADFLLGTLPQLREASDVASLYRCEPPVERPRFPGQSCPVSDGGLILLLDDFELRPDGSARVWIQVMSSAMVNGYQVRLIRRDGAVWVFDRVLRRMMTD